ncbi:ANTAR domain-containing response regulator [Sneathiella glossodoripedis]|uniref:ANTAR domain-containing response regulator n=1 Tax=Sneathiella glossodoripedis TaxID=418853 RepID=UPI000470EBDC|nr:ANTAR domain-containing protein [Sneathiella glossodoripedis]
MSAKDIKILVIDENRVRATIIQDGLNEAGHSSVTVLSEIKGVASQIETLDPDVIIIDLENPNRDMLEAMFALSKSVKRPIAMFVDNSDQQSIEAAVEAGVSSYIVDGLRQDRVKPIMDMAITRYRAFSKMERELEIARNELAERKTIDRAKSILMRSKGISEEQAYSLMRTAAMNRSQKIYEIADSIIMASSLLQE